VSENRHKTQHAEAQPSLYSLHHEATIKQWVKKLQTKANSMKLLNAGNPNIEQIDIHHATCT
jgi:hypothetical protein